MTYRERPEISQSDLKQIDKSPLKWSLGLLDTWNRDFLIGNYFHDIVLEQESDYQIFDPQKEQELKDKYKNWKVTKEYKEFYKAQNYNEYKLLFSKDVETVNNMVLNTDLSYFKDGTKEKELYFEFSGINMKGKPDYYNDTQLIDLKSIHDISEVEKAMRGYLMQAGLYHYALQQQDFKNREVIYYFVEKQEPYESVILTIPPEALEIGLKQAKHIIETKYKPFINKDTTNKKTYKVPNYLLYKFED
jgi:hypothetical protein